jgi:hypothetical protein
MVSRESTYQERRPRLAGLGRYPYQIHIAIYLIVMAEIIWLVLERN